MEDISIVTLMARLAVSMAIVLSLLLLCAKLLKKRGLGSSGGQGPTRIEVLARQGLGRTSSVQLVRVAGRTLVLGVTETSVSVLGEADPLVLEVEHALSLPSPDLPRQTPGWGPLLEAIKDRTIRS